MTTGPADASYAAEVVRLLWPAPWEEPTVVRTRHRPGLEHRDAYLFPSARRPRLLVPADVPGSSTMLRRLGAGRSGLAGPARSVLERSVRSRAFPLTRWPMLRVPASDAGAGSIEHHLAEALGTEVRVGVMLGTRRVNQKPVLQLFGPAGDLLGYAKVGHNDLTAALVRREAASLVEIRDHLPTSFRLPRVLHLGRWSDLEILVLSSLPTTAGEAVTRTARLAATREIAGLTDPVRSPLADSRFWARLRAEAERFADGETGARLAAVVAAIDEHHGCDPLRFGGWHGDWGHWNMGMAAGVLQVWDWERYDAEVPVGFDALHHDAQRVRPGERQAHRQEAAFLAGFPDRLAELGVPAVRHELTLRLYLVEIAARYLDALTHGETPALRRRTAWVLSLLERRCASLPLHPLLSEGRP